MNLFILLFSIFLAIINGSQMQGYLPADVPNPFENPVECGRPGLPKSAICDPENYLTTQSKDVIEALMNINKLALLVVNRMNESFIGSDPNADASENFARHIHSIWNSDSVNNGVLIFLSIDDNSIFISTVSGEGEILSPNDINFIISHMKEDFLSNEYGKAIEKCVVEVNQIFERKIFREQGLNVSPLLGSVDVEGTDFKVKLNTVKQTYRYISEDSQYVGYIHADVYLSKGIDGIGVFNSLPLSTQTILEVSPAIMVPTVSSLVFPKEIMGEATSAQNPNILIDYVFPAPIEGFKLVVTGWAMIYNHCTDANVGWEIVRIPESISGKRSHRFADFAVIFFTTKEVTAGEELCWNYGDDYWATRSPKSVHEIVEL